MESPCKMELAPIVIFAYNRPDHLRRTLEALAKNELASESVLYIFCDGSKEGASEEMREKVEATRALAKAVMGFKELHVVERPRNIGLKENIVGAVTEVVNRYGSIITLEDDVVTSIGFLRFMNDALETYKDEEKVMHISAYMYPHKGRLPETFFFPVPYPGGGWATWARAWKYYDDDTESVYNQWKDRWEEFDVLGGDYLSKQLKANYNRTMKTWFVKWHAVLLSRKALTLYPHQSLTNNIGFDDEATNCYATNRFDVLNLASHVDVMKNPVKVNRKASRIIYDFYQGHWYNKRRRTALMKKMVRVLTFWK